MKTIRLIYPDYLSGGLDTYYFGTSLLEHIIPANKNQKTVRVPIAPPDKSEKKTIDGIYAKEEILEGIDNAKELIKAENPDRIITLGGTCLVSLVPFDYLHGKYPDAGIIWLDAHPDVSLPENGYPNAHAMVLGSLLKLGEKSLEEKMENSAFKAEDILYVGLQGLHDYQRSFLDNAGVEYKIQDKEFISDAELTSFLNNHKHILIHFDIDVLDPAFFHSTYFANPELKGDGSTGGRMTMTELSRILGLISTTSDIAGFTIAEYLPFDEERLHNMLSDVSIFKD